MRLPLLAAILALPLALPAESLRGIPTDADFALHVSYDQAAKSKLHPVMVDLQRRMEKVGAELDPAAHRRNKELMDRLGLKPDGMHSLDLGVRFSKGANEADGPAFAAFVVARLDLSKASMETFAKAEGVAPVSMSGVNAWQFGKLADAFLKAMGAEEATQLLGEGLKDYAMMMPQDGVIVVCPVGELGKVAASYAGKSPSYELPATAQAAAKATPLPHTQIYANVRKGQATLDPESLKEDKTGLMDVAAAVGEDSKDFLINARVGFTDEAKAKLAGQQITSGFAIANLATVESEEDDAETKFFKGEAATLLTGMVVTQEGSVVTLRCPFPLDRAKVLFGKFADKAEQAMRAAHTAGQPGGADEEDSVDAPAPRTAK